MKKTPSKPREGVQATSKPDATATPLLKSKSSKSLIATATSRTPKDRTPIKPAGQEMHPALHHATTAKVLDEARWLGFQSLGAHTAPPKAMGAGQATPSKTPVPATAANDTDNVDSSPDFRFRFKSPLSMLNGKTEEATLSPRSRNILQDAGIAGTPGGGSRALFGKSYIAGEPEGARNIMRIASGGRFFCEVLPARPRASTCSTVDLFLTVIQVLANGPPRPTCPRSARRPRPRAR
jgi:hypothetical protein